MKKLILTLLILSILTGFALAQYVQIVAPTTLSFLKETFPKAKEFSEGTGTVRIDCGKETDYIIPVKTYKVDGDVYKIITNESIKKSYKDKKEVKKIG